MGSMFWHWVFVIAAGLVAGWSLAGLRVTGHEKLGHLLRGLVGALAVVGFTYSGLQADIDTAGLTLVAGLLAGICGYAYGSCKTVRRRRQAGNSIPADENQGSTDPTMDAG